MEVTRNRSRFIAESYVEICQKQYILVRVRQCIFLPTLKLLKCVGTGTLSSIGPTCGPFAAEG